MKRKRRFFSGCKDMSLFPDSEIFPIKNIEKEEVFKIVYPYLTKIKNALDNAFEHAAEDRECCVLENYLVPRRFADNVYATFCSELSKIEGIKVARNHKKNWLSVEINGVHFWIHKLDKKLKVHSNTLRGVLRINQKTDNINDSNPLIILGYTANEQNTHYDGFYFIKQNGNHIMWFIDIVDAVLSQSQYITFNENVENEEELVTLRDNKTIQRKVENI